MKPFVVHVFSIPIKRSWEHAEQLLLQLATQETAPFLEGARQHMNRLELEHGLHGLPVQPRVNLQIPEADKLNLLVRIPAPIGQQDRIEQAILRRFLEQFDSGETAGELPVGGAST